jgi:DNA ligase (NAD+)
VIIQKAGDIIPDIVQVLTKLRTGKEKVFHMPKNCPICGSSVTRKSGEAAFYCTNKKCFAKQKEALAHFAEKKGFNIIHLGPRIIEKLMTEGLVVEATDIFELTLGDFESLEHFGKKSAQNLIDAINASKEITLAKLIYALGIRHIGEENAIIIAKFLDAKNIPDLLAKAKALTVEKCNEIEGFGGIVAQSLVDYFHDKEKVAFLQKFFDLGIKIKPVEKTKQKSRVAGKKFIFTGSLKNISRDEAKDLVRDAGGEVNNSISNNLDFVVVGEEPGSKFEKAKALGLKIISEAEFLNLVS